MILYISVLCICGDLSKCFRLVSGQLWCRIYDGPATAKKKKKTWIRFELQKSAVLCDAALQVITHKTFSIIIALGTVGFFHLCFCVPRDLQPATGLVLVNSPPGEDFHFLRKEPHCFPHIWLPCIYCSQWPNLSFSFQTNSLRILRLFINHVLILRFFHKCIPTVANWLP